MTLQGLGESPRYDGINVSPGWTVATMPASINMFCQTSAWV